MSEYETTLEVNDKEIDIIVEFDYFPPEKMTRHYPGCDEDVDITDVKFDGNFSQRELVRFEEIIEDFKESLKEEIFDHIHEVISGKWDY